MTDFEDRVGAALTEGADRRPEVGGLAGRARRRARVRRRRTTGAVVVVAVLAVVAVSVPVALLQGGDEPARVVGADGGWRTVELTYESLVSADGTRRVLVDVPTDWERTADGCRLDLGPAGACEKGEGLSLGVSATAGLKRFGPGLRPAADFPDPVDTPWLGYVEVDDSGAYVEVGAEDRQTALRVLGSGRTSGEAIPDLSGNWPTTVRDGAVWMAPSGVEVEASVLAPNTDVYYSGSAARVAGGWRAGALVEGAVVRATAPTQALAEVVAGSARVLAPDEPVEAWTTRTVDGVTLEVPPGWVQLDVDGRACGGAPGTRFGPAGTDPCGAPFAVFDDTVAADLPDGRAPGIDAGYVLVGDSAVKVAGLDPETTRRVLGSARTADDPTVDTSRSWVERERDGVRWSEPPAVGVEVRVLPGSPDCASSRTPAGQRGDGRWSAFHCVDRIVEVTAPTQALADLVASTVDSGFESAGWQALEVDGVLLEVPGGWVGLDTSRCENSQARFGPEGTDPCATPAPLAVFGSELYDPVSGPGLEAGYVLTGDQVVSVDGEDPDVVRRILASAHVEGEDPGDLGRPWVERVSDGVTWSQPPASGVQVRESSAYPSCLADVADPSPAERLVDGRWRAFSCQARGATITAPTQALADLVASTIEG